MTKLAVVAVTTSLVASAFVAGVAVGKGAAPTPKFTAAEEVKWDVVNGLKFGTLFGDPAKGPYGALLRVPAGYTSPLRMSSGLYEAVQISGTSSHWFQGEDGKKAKKMTPGSYWLIPGKLEHVTACAPGKDCVMFIWQKNKYEVTQSDTPSTATSTATSKTGTGAASPPKK